MLLRPRTWATVAALVALGTLTAACGDDDDDEVGSQDTTSTTVTDDGGAPTGGTVAVTAIDYAYQGLPAQLTAGAVLTLTNASAAEVHEMVGIRIPDGETRRAEELVELSEEELGTVFGGEPEPAFVVVALPGEEGQVAVPPGGQAAVTEPGRYLIACFIPIGTDPAVYREALESGSQEAPDVEGQPHVTQGMFAEVQVS